MLHGRRRSEQSHRLLWWSEEVSRGLTWPGKPADSSLESKIVLLSNGCLERRPWLRLFEGKKKKKKVDRN